MKNQKEAQKTKKKQTKRQIIRWSKNETNPNIIRMETLYFNLIFVTQQ